MSTQGFSRAALKLFVLFVMVTWSSVLLSQISFVETEMSFMDMDAQMDVGDFDNDGDDDFVVIGGLLTSTLQRATRVYRNDNGVFTNIQANLEPLVDGACHWGDFDNDGDLDLLLSGSYGTAQSTYGNGFVKIYLNNNGIFEPTAHSFIQPFHNFSDWADYDNDGDLDIIIFGAFSSAIYRNDGGSFTNIGSLFSGWHGTSDWGDYDNDGDLDLVKAGYGPTSRIYRNNNGSFVNIGASIVNVEGACVKWGDYDNDGDLDLFISGASLDGSPPRYTKIYRNDNGVFVDSMIDLLLLWGASAEWCDFDQDGDLDLAYCGTNGVTTRLVVYENTGSSFAQLLQTSSGGGCKQKMEVGDFNNDGLMDIYTCGYYDQIIYMPKILYNSTSLAPPGVLQAIDPMVFNMNGVFQEIDLSEYFSGSTEFSYTNNQNAILDLSSAPLLRVQPISDWYGTEYITIRATNSHGYVEQTLKVTVYQTWRTEEHFDYTGVVPDNWTTTHAGTTDFPWQPIQIEGDDYAMKTMANTGRTANERLFSPTYNLSNYKDVVVSFDTDFLPYGTGSGTFAYTLNNVTYTVVETFSAATSGMKTYPIPNLDAKPSVKFRWIYANSSANTGQDNHWIVDDFSIFGVVRDTQAPSAVNGLTLSSQTSSSASLSWQASSDIYFGRYELYVSSDDQVTTTDQLWSAAQDPALYNVDTIQTTITGLATGDYWIAIRAVDQSNNASAMSDPVFVQIDGAVPVFSNPTPALQPEPLWINSRTVEIGCSISDFNLIDPNSLNYRIDANGNGIYDDSEAWTAMPQAGRQIRNRDELTIFFDVSYEADGVLAFEFQATDFYGNIGYSGLSSQEGISDDWVVRIDSSAPVISSPVPANQPEPEWQQTLAVQIGCTVEDMTTIASIEYRFDNNGNGSYDAEEAWQSYPLSRTGTRDMLIVELPVEFAVDGTRCFEFRATDVLGNVSYSGASGLEGIEDDWVVRMDTTAPTFSDPIPANQPNPVWATLLEVEIGATIYDHNDIDNASIMYRVDLNKNGIYDPEEEWTPLILRYGDYRNSLPINTQITIPGDGVYAFEFKAEDSLGNVGYSGLSGINGIEDDWMVMVDTNPPFFSLPIPGDQPLPLWSNNYSVTIGSTILDSLAIDMNSVQYRYDQNQNGIYDTDEIWQNIGLTRNSSVRSVAVEIEVPLTLSTDGIYKFEFRASDPNEVTGYSGLSQLQGIDDDWIFRVDTVPPAAISNFFVQDVTDYSIQLTWTASADLNFLGYRIYYSTSSDVSTADSYWDWNNDPNLSLAGTGLVSTVLSGLYPATRYYFMILATDEVGWVTQYPQIITAMTTSFAEPEAPENLSISIVDGLLILNWDDVTQDVLGNPIIPSYYDVFVGDHPDFICNFDSLIATVNESYLELDDVVDYADRLFFKVIAHIGMIRNGK